MTMTLNVQESGKVKYIKCPGAVLEAGCVIARLELDDPSKVHPVRSVWHGHPGWSDALMASTCLFSELSRLRAPGAPSSSPDSPCVPLGVGVTGSNMPSFAQTPLSSSPSHLE